MWMFTEIGFFSAVAADPKRVEGLSSDRRWVMVRARVREDLVNLVDLLVQMSGMHLCQLPKYPETQLSYWKAPPQAMPEILAWKNRDYPYRIIIVREIWAEVCEHLASEIDYTNFKDRVTAKQGYPRHDLYMGVWSTMNRAEQKLTAKKDPRGGKGQESFGWSPGELEDFLGHTGGTTTKGRARPRGRNRSRDTESALRVTFEPKGKKTKRKD
jgi:hypothetical protein